MKQSHSWATGGGRRSLALVIVHRGGIDRKHRVYNEARVADLIDTLRIMGAQEAPSVYGGSGSAVYYISRIVPREWIEVLRPSF